jgi:branched-chain amino acid transport system ATP-binding protein
MAVLEASGLHVQFGELLAVHDVDLSVERAEIVGLIGPNGAGKTTTFNAVSGVQRCRGRVLLDGEDISTASPHRRVRRGMSRTFQRLELFGSMSARDNIQTAGEITARSRRRSHREVTAHTEEILDLLGLEAIADERAETLPTGRARLVEVGRALATDPKIVLLDEPASGLDEHETRQLAGVLERVRDAGVAVLMVEHDLDLVMDLCSRIYVMSLGEVIACGSPDEVRRDAAVQDAYLGAAVA